MPSIATACERMRYLCDEANLGYDQNQRWNIYPGGECDCSSLVIHVLQEAGFDTGDASYTGNMAGELCSRGWNRLPADISTCKPGDILLNESHHTCLVIDGYGWGATIGQASIDENGRARGGASGDQSGRETNTGGVYEYWAGWDCILRFNSETDDDDDDDDDETIFNEREDTMQFLYQPDEKPEMRFFDGTKVIRLSHPDQMQAIIDCYKMATGRDIAIFKYGYPDAPRANRLEQCFPMITADQYKWSDD